MTELFKDEIPADENFLILEAFDEIREAAPKGLPRIGSSVVFMTSTNGRLRIYNGRIKAINSTNTKLSYTIIERDGLETEGIDHNYVIMV